MEPFHQDPRCRALARSLAGRTIRSALPSDDGQTALVHLYLDDGRLIKIGAYGSLWDEAYPVFSEEST